MDKMPIMHDTGIQHNTLSVVIKELLNNGTIDVRKLILPLDKKANYSDGYEYKDYLIQNEIFIFKQIVSTLKLKSGNEEIISSIEKLDDKELKKYFSGIAPQDPNVLKIFFMSKLDDYGGSHREDLFETRKQKSVNSKTTVDYTKRIYLNIPLNKSGIDFLTQFKLKCIEKGIPSKMKGFGSSGEFTGEIDTTIIYSNDFYLLDHINILETLIKEKPELFSKMGSPVISGARVESNDGNCYYTISSGLFPNGTSNDYYDGLYKRSFAVLCLKHINKKEMSKELIDYCLNVKISEIKNINNSGKEILKLQIEAGDIEINSLINEYAEIVKYVSSMMRFNDMDHTEVPLYQDEIFMNFSKNIKTERQIDKTEIDKNEKNLYLYQTEVLINEALYLYQQGDISFEKLMQNYINRINSIYKKYRYYALREPGFVMSDRYVELKLLFEKIMISNITEYEKESKIDKLEYYQYIQSKINEYLNSTNGFSKN